MLCAAQQQREAERERVIREIITLEISYYCAYLTYI
jgi:hypothetical protein